MYLNMADHLCGDEFSAKESSLNGKIVCRDYFPAKESSLNGRNSLQGLFSGGGIIPERKKLFAGIIFQRRNHP